MEVVEEVQQRFENVAKIFCKEWSQLVTQPTHYLEEGELIEFLEIVTSNFILTLGPLNEHIKCLLQLNIIHF